MATNLITIRQTNDPEINITIKTKDGYGIPDSLTAKTVLSFRVWTRTLDYVVVFINEALAEVSVSIPHENIEWISSTIKLHSTDDRFRIDNSCDISTEELGIPSTH